MSAAEPRLRRLWGLAVVVLAALGAAAEPLHPSQVYRVVDNDGHTAYLAPGVAFAAESSLELLPGTPTLAACELACREEPDCVSFEFCETQTGCDLSTPPLKPLDCRLVANNCSHNLLLAQRDPRVRRISGFPLKHEPVELPGYNTVPVQALDSGEFACAGSVLPGRCAFDSVVSAASACSSMAACRSVVYYHNGTDSCSDPVAVLTTSLLTEDNAVIVPTADVLTKAEDAVATTVLMASDGTVLLPTDAELAAAANASDPDTAWLGCIIAEGALIDGSVVAVASGVATAEECCRACRANSTCNVWNYCAQPGGCSFAASSPITGEFTVNLTQGQCELRYQAAVASGWPPIVLAKGSNVPLTAGTPMAVTGPQLPGYVALPGRHMLGVGGFKCQNSTMGDVEECVITETPQQLAERCNADPECVAFDVHPLPGPPSPLRTGLLKHAFNESMLSMSPTDFTYVHESVAGSSSSSGGGLSSGALAGIAVGACAAAAVLAGAVWLVLRRRQQRQPCLPVSSSLHSKQVASGGGGSKPGDASIPDPPSTGTASSTLPNSLCPSGNTSTGFMDGSDSQAGSSTKEHSTGALMPGMPEGMPWVKFPRRAAWQPSAVASPFAADAGTPFVAPMSPTAASPTHGFTPTSARSQQLTASRVQPISAADAAAVVAAAALSGTITSSSNSNNNSQEPPVPELAQYVAQCEAALSQGPSQSFMQAHKQLMSVDCLPASLKASVVDVSQIRYLTTPDGQLQEIGSGASGSVYRALYLNEIVAAKEIDIGRSQATQEAFVNEALRLHQLHHPHVVALLGVTLAGSTGILLMEYCAGRDLRSALGLTTAAGERLFGWQRRGRRVVLEIAKALNFLHARGVVHMDVKSNNVLLTAGGTAKLADVGLARLQTGTYLSDVPLIGTFAWIAPEVLMGGKQCSSAVDIYSFGVVMWEVITGERPQRGHLRAPRVSEECPQDIANLMMECMRLEPSERPTASQIVRRLEGRRCGLEESTVDVPVRSPTSPPSSAAGTPADQSRGSAADRSQ